MESSDSSARQAFLELYLCIQAQCAGRVVRLKIRTADPSSRELSGPDLSQTLRKLVAELHWAATRLAGLGLRACVPRSV
jgi:hypothetical protein